jgi:hypothetical protein
VPGLHTALRDGSFTPSIQFARGVAHMALYLDTAIPPGKVSAPATPFVRISVPGRAAVYFLSCLAISTAIYVVFGQPILAFAAGLAIVVWTWVAIRERRSATTNQESPSNQES